MSQATNYSSSPLDGPDSSKLVENAMREIMSDVGDALTLNEMQRREMFKRVLGRDRTTIDEDCGYEPTSAVTVENLFHLWQRDPIAKRCISLWPSECWAKHPKVYDIEPEKESPFEKAVEEMVRGMNGKSYADGKTVMTQLWSMLETAEELSLIGNYGAIVLGFDDKRALSEPLQGFEDETIIDQGLTSNEFKAPAHRKLLYAQPYSQHHCRVTQWFNDKGHPKFGEPRMYEVRNDSSDSIEAAVAMPLGSFEVHWSRVVHLCPHYKGSAIMSDPQLLVMLDRLVDLKKVYGGAGEGFFQGALPGIKMEPSGQDVRFDDESYAQAKTALNEYVTRMKRFLASDTMKIGTIAPTVVSPEAHIAIAIEAICIVEGWPIRIFKGSERGELASSQDTDAFDGRVEARCHKVVTPRVVAPFFDRLIEVGTLPEPADGGWKLDWPSLKEKTKQDKAELASITVKLIGEYIKAGVAEMIAPMDLMTKLLGFEPDEAREILKGAMEEAADDLDDMDEGLPEPPTPPLPPGLPGPTPNAPNPPKPVTGPSTPPTKGKKDDQEKTDTNPTPKAKESGTPNQAAEGGGAKTADGLRKKAKRLELAGNLWELTDNAKKGKGKGKGGGFWRTTKDGSKVFIGPGGTVRGGGPDGVVITFPKAGETLSKSQAQEYSTHFHGTLESNLQSIMKSGIDSTSVKRFDESSKGERSSKVFSTTDKKVAEWYATSAALYAPEGAKAVVFELQVPKTAKLSKDSMSKDSWMIDKIPPSWIKSYTVVGEDQVTVNRSAGTMYVPVVITGTEVTSNSSNLWTSQDTLTVNAQADPSTGAKLIDDGELGDSWELSANAEVDNPLNVPFRTSGGNSKFAVYVKNDKGNIVLVRFGDPGMKIKRSDPARRSNFRSRHGCDKDPGPKWKAKYWSCRMWEKGKTVAEVTGNAKKGGEGGSCGIGPGGFQPGNTCAKGGGGGDGFPDHSDLTDTGKALGGSTGATQVKDSAGNLYVKKYGNSPEHLQNEFDTEQIYKAAGVKVSESKMYEDVDGKKFKLAKWEEGKPLSATTGTERDLAIKAIQKDLAIDATVANWDVIGMNEDNVLVRPNANGAGVEVVRLDVAGSMSFRAQGGDKGSLWNDENDEVNTLRDNPKNPTATKIFGGMSDADVASSFQRHEDKLEQIVKAAPVGEQQRLKARLENGFNKVKSADGPAPASQGAGAKELHSKILADPAVGFTSSQQKKFEYLNPNGVHADGSVYIPLVGSSAKDPKNDANIEGMQLAMGPGVKIKGVYVPVKALSSGKEFQGGVKENSDIGKKLNDPSIFASGPGAGVAVGSSGFTSKVAGIKLNGASTSTSTPVKSKEPAKPKLSDPSVQSTLKSEGAFVMKQGQVLSPGKEVGSKVTLSRDIPPKTEAQLQSLHKEFDAKLSYKERDALVNWKGSAREHRERLAKGPGHVTEEDASLLTMLQKAPSYEGVTYRGVHGDYAKEMSATLFDKVGVGGIWSEPAPACSSRNSKTGVKFSQRSGGTSGGAMLLKIKTKSGGYVGRTKGFHGEDEVMLRPNTPYRITKLVKDASLSRDDSPSSNYGVNMYVEMEEI